MLLIDNRDSWWNEIIVYFWIEDIRINLWKIEDYKSTINTNQQTALSGYIIWKEYMGHNFGENKTQFVGYLMLMAKKYPCIIFPLSSCSIV